MSKQKGDESAFGVAAGSAYVFVAADWVKDIIEGPQGMNSFQRHEMVIWNEPERIAAANWVLRCLANPRCEGSDQMLHATTKRRLIASSANSHKATSFWIRPTYGMSRETAAKN